MRPRAPDRRTRRRDDQIAPREIVRQVRLSGLLMGVSFQSPADKKEDENWWYASGYGIGFTDDKLSNVPLAPR